jgi:hypothetical protein
VFFTHIFSGLLGKVGQRYRQFKSDSDRLAQKIRVVAVLEIGASQRTTDQRAITGRQHRASIGISIAKRRLEWAGNYAACRRVISASATTITSFYHIIQFMIAAP